MRRVVVASALVVAVAAGTSTAGDRLPTPQSYGETCSLVGSWCGSSVPSGNIPATLRRRLHLPKVRQGAACPRASGWRIDNDQFAGTALGRGPVTPLIAPPQGAGDVRHGIVPFRRSPGTKWWGVKTLWFSKPRYRGPVFIRGRRLDGTGSIVFGESPSLVDPQLPPGPTLNGTKGWRQWPGGTYIRSLGCYAWQVDGRNFSYMIAFKAVKA